MVVVVVDVWDEPPFVPRQGHCSSPHNVDTPETARSHTFTPRTATAHRSAGTAAAHRPPSASPSDESGINAFSYAHFH